MFLEQLEYQMELIRPKRLNFLHRAWDHVQIDEAYYQSEGDCNIGAINYARFPFKEFDESATICDNLDNFASNAKQFFENFLCMDNHETPNITKAKWQEKATKIEKISQTLRAHPISEWSLCSEDPFHPNATTSTTTSTTTAEPTVPPGDCVVYMRGESHLTYNDARDLCADSGMYLYFSKNRDQLVVIKLLPAPFFI